MGMLADHDELYANETCKRLIDAASEQFARHGFSSARVRRIVDAANVNLAAVNYYFGGKEGLYRATLRFLAGQPHQGSLGHALRGGSPEERLERRVLSILERFIGTDRPSAFGRIIAHEAVNPTAYLDSILEDTMRPELDRIRELLRELAGPELGERELEHAALGVMGQCLLYLYARNAVERLSPELVQGPERCRELARQITEFSLGGIERLRSSPVVRT
jgi:AcrR family transcriptional regulator